MDKPYLFMLPGWSMDETIWGSFSEELSKRFKIEYLDWTDINSIDSFRGKLDKHISKLEAKKVNLLGWSLGAMVAIEFAADSPKCLDKLILLSPTARFTQDRATSYRAGWNHKVLDMMAKNLDLEIIDTLKAFRKKLFSENEKHRYGLEVALDTLEDQKLKGSKALKQGLEYLKRVDFRDRVCEIKIPTLMIHGEVDGIVPVEAAKDIAERNMSYFELQTIEGCGHAPFLTEMELCLKYIWEFIDRGDCV